MTRSGLFIALDGIDGSGKSTQCRLLADWFRELGHHVRPCADPGGTDVGDRIRRIVLAEQLSMDVRCEMFLFMASRAELVSRVIAPSLRQGDIVVCDRFLLANVAYQGYGGGLDPSAIWEIGRFATSDTLPDLTVVLDLPLEEAIKRRGGKADRLEKRDEAYHGRVREGFLTEARAHPESIVVVNATGPVDEVHARIRAHVEPLLHRWRGRSGGQSSNKLST